ncbi:hypothetical protein F511_20272 [Dorcoceras hygrometricum]|uniref:Uncharacterized protein n=1 Tax=Dorcoceras hygrometricum TaxID=472368 RepID=A0A2Z7BV86_9LAMI|nr:hypothetical protein F511_20272 [Dorcoceras hygrometricum]
MAEQSTNAKMVVEEMKTGLRVCTDDGTSKGFETNDDLKNSVIELMEGEKGKALKEAAKGLAEAAKKAVVDSGSSWHAVSQLIDELHHRRKEIKT